MTERKLGKGLDTLLSSAPSTEAGTTEGAPKPASGSTWVPTGNLIPNPQQPRKELEGGHEALAESIRRHGILQPILVTRLAGDRFQILAGERRWRAAQAAGFKNVPVVVREEVKDAATRLELALVENLDRSNLNPIEKGLACKEFLTEFGWTQERVAERLGFDRSTVSNLVRILDLPADIRNRIASGELGLGHGKALLTLLERPAAMEELCKRCLEEDWTVRMLEKECRLANKDGVRPQHAPRPSLPSWLGDLQDRLTRAVGQKAEIRLRRGNSGRLILHFDDLDQLDRLAQHLRPADELSELE